mmetsp:Transcript_18724/g.29377  ORF Transcript_18724/g.29377 Transcript_18724/m.29377 type:complete len:210 (+) Transcript_18724:399-1028(+)
MSCINTSAADSFGGALLLSFWAPPPNPSIAFNPSAAALASTFSVTVGGCGSEAVLTPSIAFSCPSEDELLPCAFSFLVGALELLVVVLPFFTSFFHASYPFFSLRPYLVNPTIFSGGPRAWFQAPCLPPRDDDPARGAEPERGADAALAGDDRGFFGSRPVLGATFCAFAFSSLGCFGSDGGSATSISFINLSTTAFPDPEGITDSTMP